MKLSAEDVAFIRASTESGTALGRRFGVAKQTISNIRLGYTHQPKPPRKDGKLHAKAEGRLVTSQQAEVVRAVLERAPTESHQAAAAAWWDSVGERSRTARTTSACWLVTSRPSALAWSLQSSRGGLGWWVYPRRT